jgi:hypothetical protein
MGSPSLNSPPTTAYSIRQQGAPNDCQAVEQHGRATATDDIVLIVGFRDALAADYAAFVNRNSDGTAVLMVGDEKIRRLVESPVRSLSMDEFLCTPSETWCEEKRVAGLIVFINSRLSESERQELDVFLGVARQRHKGFVGIISTFRLHLDDPRVTELENQVVSLASEFSARVAVFRPGHVLSRHSSVSRFLERFASMYPLVPERLGSCFIDGEELFAAVERKRLEAAQRADSRWPRISAERARLPKSEGRSVDGKIRAYSFLGPNEPWRALLFRHRTARPRPSVTTAVSQVFSWLFVGHLLALVLTVLGKGLPWWRQWIVHTLEPRSMRELLSLCHAGNVDHVKVVGYNNGVVHFGHSHPGKTIISTIHCRRTVHAGAHMLKADCGATVRTALDYLADSHEELYVVPNYSYVCLGTSFFVPIHGSAVDYSTVADTICRVVLFDPDSDRIFSATRDDVAFREHVYNLHSRAIVLRLYIRTRPKASYFVHRETLENPAAADILAALHDDGASNVEIRQSHAASAKVTVARYYNDPGETTSPALELPRDTLGSLWDRLEENPITSFLMHALSKRVAWHTELFFTRPEFDVFWRTRGRLPLRKIQLRYLRRDGLPHSPFRDEDRVSADLFMFRRHRSRFLSYLQSTFSNVRTNPGKHSG